MGYYREQRNVELLKEYLKLPEDVRQKLEKSEPRREVEQHEDLSYDSSLFTEIAKKANKFAKKWNKSIKDVRVEHSCYQQDYSDSYSSELHLEVKGLETDDQYHLRLVELHEATRIREEYERKEFQRLSAKFAK